MEYPLFIITIEFCWRQGEVMTMHVLIVDDDATTRSGLMKHAPWEKYKVDMMQAAASAQEALALCETWQPDIVLSDIRMRGLTGLDLCMRLRVKYPDCQMILISAYSEKEYLKAAIEIGVVNYVDKPVRMETLEAALDKAVQRLEEISSNRDQAAIATRSMPYVRQETLLGLLDGKPASSLRLDALPTALFNGIGPLRAGICRTAAPVVNVLQFHQHLEQHLSNEAEEALCERICCAFTENRRMLFLYRESDTLTAALRSFSSRPFNGIPLFLALGSPATGFGGLKDSYRDALAAEQTLFHTGYGHCTEETDGNAFLPFDTGIYDAFSSSLTRGKDEDAAEILQQVREQLKNGKAVLGTCVHTIYFTLLLRVHQQMLRQFPEQAARLREELDTRTCELESLETLDDFHALLQEQLGRLMGRAASDAGNTSAVLQVTRSIEQNYHRSDLSIQALADQVFLTPTYLSALFKQKTGTTIGRYLLDVRIQEAKRLLWDKQLKLYQVAQKVGFDDANYFAKAFKKAVGVTPSEYRDQEI